MNNRIPVYILGLLVLLALVWRIANPPPPVLPGPLGVMPNWTSMVKTGEMSAAAVSPDGTKWAGVWNDSDTRETKRSAVVVIDLAKKTSQHVKLADGLIARSLFWRDNNSFTVLLADSEKPAVVTRSLFATCTLTKGKPSITNKPLEEMDIAAILASDPSSGSLVVRLGGSPVRVAVLDRDLQIVGKEISLDLSDSAEFYDLAAISPAGDTCVFAVEKSDIGGLETFCLADAKTRTVKELFTSKDLPGIVEGMWLSPRGVLIAASEMGKFSVVRYDTATGKLIDVSKEKAPLDLKTGWPDAPEKMLFVAYDGGYQLDLATGKAAKIIKFDASDRETDYWRKEVQNGRLYPREGGDYTSVSYAAKTVDIRVIDKDGKSSKPILGRR